MLRVLHVVYLKIFLWNPKDILFSMITYLINSQENSSARVSFLMTLQTKVYNFIKKETLTQVFSCEFCKISKNIFSYRTFPVATSVNKIFHNAK